MASDNDDPASGDHPFFDRRSGKDRRRDAERRVGGRRHQLVESDQERRSGSDRRAGTRRKTRDRRRVVDRRYKKHPQWQAGSSYDMADLAAVQRMLSKAVGRPACPVCGGRFALGRLERRANRMARQVWCSECGRGAVVAECVLARVMVLSSIDPLRNMLRTIMTAAGHEVLEPEDTDAALEVYRENPADVVILDSAALTLMDGSEFLRRLRQQFKDPRIIILAPRPSPRSADPAATATQLGATRIVRMPFTREEILRALKEARAPA